MSASFIDSPASSRTKPSQRFTSTLFAVITLSCLIMDEAIEIWQNQDGTLRVVEISGGLPATPAGAAGTAMVAAREDDLGKVDTDVRQLLEVKKSLRELFEGCHEPDKLRSVVLKCCNKKKQLRGLRKKYDKETLVASVRRVVHGDQSLSKSEACTEDTALPLGCTGPGGVISGVVEAASADVEEGVDGTLSHLAWIYWLLTFPKQV